jgi:hypothetical protein
MPASNSTNGFNIETKRGGQNWARSIAQPMPKIMPIINAPHVTASDPTIIEKIPNSPSDGYQSMENINLTGPTFTKIGKPSLKMKMVINASPQIAVNAISRSIQLIILSVFIL